MIWNKVLFLRKRNVGLGFLKLKLVFLYYKVQTTAVLPGSVQKNDPTHFSKYWALLNTCFTGVAMTQHSRPLRSESARRMCFRKCVALCRLIVYLSHFFFFFAVSHKAAGKVERPHNQKVQRPEPNIALALPLTNWDSGQVTSPCSLPISEAVTKRARVLTVFRQCWVSKTPGGVLSWDLTPLGSLVWGKPMHQTVLNARDFIAHPRPRFTRLSVNNSRSSAHLQSARYVPGTQTEYLTYIISLNPYNNPEVVTIIIPVFQCGN